MEKSFLESFKEKCDDVYVGGFIMCEQKIYNLLAFIAKNELIYSIVERCTQNYDYYSAKSKCFLDKNGDKSVKVPSDRQDAIAFCYSLMYEIYSGKVMLNEILDNYFFGNVYKDRFSSFWFLIVKRFYQDIVSVIEDMENLIKKEENEQSSSSKKEISFLDSVKNQLYCQKIKTEDRKLAIYFINKIIESITLNLSNSEIAYYGLKASLKEYKKMNDYVDKIGELLENRNEISRR